MNALLNIILFLWELPQNLLGIAYLLTKTVLGSVMSRMFERNRLFVKVQHGAVSLGLFVFWSDTGDSVFTLDERNRLHEYGHSIQSRILGPLYLPVVGIPSVSRVIYAHRYYRKHGREWTGYYRGFPENWADRLGNVRSGAL
jgi:hypothetical protein